MALLYKNAKKEVDKEFAEIKAKGYTPVSNKDGTYSWVNAEGGKYTGDLDPTGGRDAEATWGQQHFKRQARQDKIMSRKVSGELAMAPSKPVEKSGTGTGGSGSGSDGKSGSESSQSATITRVEPVAKAKTEGVVSPKNSGVVNIPPSKTLRPSNIPQYKEGDTKPIGVPYVSAADTNTEDPYIYVDQEEYQAANPAWSRAIGNVYGGTYMSDIQQLKGGMNTSNIGLQGKAGYVPRTRIMDPGDNQLAGRFNMTDEAEKLGHKQVLIKNPNFKKPIGSPAMVAGNIAQDIQSLTAPGSLLGPTSIVTTPKHLASVATAASRSASRLTKAADKPGKWYKPGSKLNAAVNRKAATSAMKNAERVGEKAAAAFDKAGKPISKAAEPVVKAAEKPISKMKELGARKVPTGKPVSPSSGSPIAMGTKGAPQLPAGQAMKALGPYKAPMIGDGAAKAKSVIDNILKAGNIKLKPPTKLAPGFESGGKLKPKSSTEEKGN